VSRVEAATKPFKIELNGKIMEYINPTINVMITGKPINTGDMPALAIDNRTLLPAREFFESAPINAKVEWIAKTQEVQITYADKFIVLKIDDKTAYVNGVATQLDVPATIIRDVTMQYGKTMVPLRFISEALGFNVDWINETNTANVTPTNTGSGNATTTNWSADETTIKQALSQQNNIKIEAKNLPLANINSITTDNKLGETYRINTDAPVSNVKISEWDGMLILDVENSKRNTNTATYSFGDSTFVREIRTSQFKVAPLVTRLVFHFNEKPEKYNVSLSEDRKEIIVSISNNNILAVEAAKDTNGDYIKIISTMSPNIVTTRENFKIIFDIQTSTSLIGSQLAPIAGQYLTGITVNQYNDNTVRIVGETNKQSAYAIDQVQTDVMIDGNTYKKFITTIRLKGLDDTGTTPTVPPVTEEPNEEPSEEEGTIFRLPLPTGITQNMITSKEDYFNNKFTITIPNNCIDYYRSQQLVIDNQLVTNVQYALNKDGNTDIIITAKTVYVYTVKIENGALKINIRNPRDVYDKIVVVDPGHGGDMPGAIYSNIKEKVFNYKIFEYIKKMADEQNNIKIYYTRLDDTDASFDSRSGMAAKVGADLFVSIHNNALPQDVSIKGTIVFHQQKWTGEIGTRSKTLANIMQKSITGSAGTYDRGIRTADYRVLRDNTVPCVLIECAFMTNKEDMGNLQKDEFLQKIATGIYNGFNEYFAVYPSGR
jgi:N-acetylmuramoyl-L-alanine amidase